MIRQTIGVPFAVSEIVYDSRNPGKDTVRAVLDSGGTSPVNIGRAKDPFPDSAKRIFPPHFR